MATKNKSYWFYLKISFFGASTTALTFVVALFFKLPPNDEAKKQGLLLTLCDPFVFTTAGFVALVLGVVISPILFYSLRKKRLRIALPIVLLSPPLATILFMPLSNIAAFVASCFALIAAIGLCQEFPDETED
jgi:hypothetical protein